MENINLSKILKGHIGETFYCTVYGDVVLTEIRQDKQYPICIDTKEYIERPFSTQLTSNGMFTLGAPNSECILFPSKTQRDWNKWWEEHRPNPPKTWSEYINSEYYEWDEVIGSLSMQDKPIYKFMFALYKIHQLIEVGYSGNVTNEEWNNIGLKKYVIIPLGISFVVDEKMYPSEKSHITFHTQEQAKKFLKYPENVQILKDYFMCQ